MGRMCAELMIDKCMSAELELSEWMEFNKFWEFVFTFFLEV